ncbi:uncharacterized protein Cpr73D [Planococcus citri]|uniref:uncharacterized protein Cpr73D n=1 Tax=Planococcus citri TaxID=170843 RepID=UPI0031F78726
MEITPVQFLQHGVVLLLYFGYVLSQQTTEIVPLEGPDENFIDRGQDGSYRFGYKNLDTGAHYHTAAGSRDNTVSGRYGFRDPTSRRITQTTYTAGDRGFRARGPDIARQMDLSQTKIPYNPPVPPNSPNYQPSYDTYFDPNEDPSYKFNFKTPTYTRGEAADSKGTVNGAFSFVDDVGKRHDVQYEAGSKVGFHVKTPFPDSDPFGGIFYQGPNKPGSPPRGHIAIVRSNDGGYKFTSSGPDQQRTEVSDSANRVRGSYTYIDDKGVQRTVQYIAGPNIGYKVIRKGAGPIYSSVYPYTSPEFINPTLNDNVLPNINTLPSSTVPPSFGSDLFEPPANNFDSSKPDDGGSNLFGNSNDFLGPNDKPNLNPFSTSTFAPDLPTEKPNYSYGGQQPQKPYYQSYKPPKPTDDYYNSGGSNSYQPSYGSQNLKPFQDDLFGDNKPSGGGDGGGGGGGYDSSGNDGGYGSRPFSGSSGYGPVRKPSNAYIYPKPDKAFNEEPTRDYSSANDNRYSGSSKNFLGLPPGFAVRAHVQSLDILPYGSKIPPPDEALQRHLFEEQHRSR